MFVLFLFCIVAPGVVFGYLSLRRVDAKFHQDTLRGMRLRSREIAMSIHGGFSSIGIQVEFLADILGNTTPRAALSSSGWEWLSDNRLLLGVTRIHEGSRAESLYGSTAPPPPNTPRARAHLSSGNGLLYLQRSPGGGHRFFMAYAIPGKSPERELLSCELNLDYLWERIRDAIPPVSEVAVLSPDGAALFHSRPPPSGLLERIGRERHKGAAGNLEWGPKSEALLVDHTAVFLKPAFFSDDWTVVITRPRSEAFAAANRFTRVLFLTIALVILVAGLFALVQIRRNIAPLAVLKEGTRRISGGDFDSRIEIGSGDEFEELAGSFNTMADHLGTEFRTQAEMGRIVQAILGETDPERIARALLDNVDSVIPCDCAGLSLLDPRGRENAAVTSIRGEPPTDPSGTGRPVMFLRPDEIERLEAAESSLVAMPGGEFEGFLSHWPGPSPAAFLLSPLVSHGNLAGVLLLGHSSAAEPAPESLVRLRQIADQATIALNRARLLEEIHAADLGTLQALSRAVDTNSPWTAGHSQRVTALAMDIGRELGLPPREIDLLHRGGLLHDIGKLGIPPSILDKPAKLTEEEFTVIKRHPAAGADILRPIPALEKIIPIVSQHHERFDGKGYPLGLSGEDISLNARILAVADVVDALSSDRPYRAGWPQEKVLAYVLENARLQFDPGVVDSFLRIEERKTGDSPAGRGPADLSARQGRETPFSQV